MKLAIGWCVGLALVVVAFLGGCNFPAMLHKAHEGIKGMSQQFEPRVAADCVERAKVCKSNGVDDPEKCPAVVECKGWIRQYAFGVKQAHKGLAACNRVYAKAKKKGVLP